jgi:hypothetical protein
VDRRYQVFVSSTYTDLIEERRELIQALLEMECLPAGMELFPAANESQWDLIKQAIDDSDYYVVVVGGRYGSMGPEGVSYTEQEYDYAVSTGMPVLGFVHADPDSLPRSKSEVDPDGYARLAAFRNKVKTRPVRFYTSAEDLGGKVSRSLTIARTRDPREGWIRGRFAMTPEQQTEMAELRALVVELQRDLETSARTVIPEDLSSGSDTHSIFADLSYYTQEELSSWKREKEATTGVMVMEASWDDIFTAIGPALIDESPENRLRSLLNNMIRTRWYEEPSSVEFPDDLEQLRYLEITEDSLNDIVIQFFALGLIQRGVKKRPISDKTKYWALTSRGEDELFKLRAIRRTIPSSQLQEIH